MSPVAAVATGGTLVWLGMVLAISFLEAPLKFRAPGVTLQLGLGIGRLVFRALNAAELVLAATVVLAAIIAGVGAAAAIAVGVAVVLLLAQLVLIRPTLTARSDAVLEAAPGTEPPRSTAHYWYVGAEVAKVLALLVGGALLLTA
ncbi:hypothetical protein [Nocardioides sp. YIM 152588]|uniref:hypothetical protein n=1 Tax=Nocardioides sp. YIM 152588 TaxID=3158259 RepID=UPI0032E3A7E1